MPTPTKVPSSRRRQRTGGGMIARSPPLPDHQRTLSPPPTPSSSTGRSTGRRGQSRNSPSRKLGYCPELPSRRPQTSAVLPSQRMQGRLKQQQQLQGEGMGGEGLFSGRSQNRCGTSVSGRRRANDLLWQSKSERVFRPYIPDQGCGFYTTTPECEFSRAFADDSIIQPRWNKVTTTPVQEASRITGGFGRRLQNGSESVEAPPFWSGVSSAYPVGGPVTYHRKHTFKQLGKPTRREGHAFTAVSSDSPSFFQQRHTQVYGTTPEVIPRPEMMKVLVSNLVLMEPLVDAQTVRPPLEWDEQVMNAPVGVGSS